MNLFMAEFKVHSCLTENELVPPTYSAAKLATVLLDRKIGFQLYTFGCQLDFCCLLFSVKTLKTNHMLLRGCLDAAF